MGRKSPKSMRSTVLMIAVAAVWLSGCSNKLTRMGVPVGPGSPMSEPPVFQKVPAAENTAVIQAEGEGAVPSGPYLLDVDDHLDISIYGEEELQHIEVPVRPDGMISFAFVGDIKAAGRTVEDVRKDLTESLGKYLRSPQVMLIAKEFAQKKVFLGGEVKNPGVLYLKGREGTLLDALYKGGLVTDKADLEGSYIMRGNKIVAADFKGLVRGDVARNVHLRDQDVIYVPENVNRYVYVLGEVRRVDALEIGEPIPMIQVLARAGGVPNTGKQREIAVIRGGLKSPEVAIVNAKALLDGDLSQNILIKPGDIIYVAKNALGHYNDFIDIVLRTISPFVQGVIVSREVNPTRPDPSPNN